MSKKKILFYTGSRADYGLLKPLIDKVKKKIDTSLVVGPHHLEKKLGYTYSQISKNQIKKKFFCKTKINYNNVDVAKFIGESIFNYKKIIEKYDPSLIVLLGDRYEVLSFALASFFSEKPICHIHGGEITKGSFDDTIRHVITKLSHYHFVCSEVYRKRVLRMGENKSSIYNFGSLGAENVKRLGKLSRKDLIKKYKFSPENKLILITFHPETSSNIKYDKQIRILLKSLESLDKMSLVFTGSNADPFGQIFNKRIKEFVKNNSQATFIQSMGNELYSSFLKSSDLVLGNSSSAIIEAPSCGTLVLNVGSRQQGREKSKLVHESALDDKLIIKKIKQLSKIKDKKIGSNIFYKKNTSYLMSRTILQIIKKKIPQKYFVDASN
ncbi:UDP-N-acetylglucosamine 2-epimerase [Candidatus Pelagibacter sp.]|nr:UDP-N-acetylglucosamine 2-epimerase [Candidatus Pelagibacter sp.]